MLVWEAISDYETIKSGGVINHAQDAFFRGVIIVLLFIFDLPWLPLAFTLYWIFFEALLNYKRGLSLLYVGYTARLDKLTRKIFPENPEIGLLCVKIISLSLSIFILYVI